MILGTNTRISGMVMIDTETAMPESMKQVVDYFVGQDIALATFMAFESVGDLDDGNTGTVDPQMLIPDAGTKFDDAKGHGGSKSGQYANLSSQLTSRDAGVEDLETEKNENMADEDAEGDLLAGFTSFLNDKDDPDMQYLNSEAGKKLSSKERRQLRNKISARNFRNRRKEYIAYLEQLVQKQNREKSSLKNEISSLKRQNASLSEKLELQRQQFEDEAPPALASPAQSHASTASSIASFDTINDMTPTASTFALNSTLAPTPSTKDMNPFFSTSKLTTGNMAGSSRMRNNILLNNNNSSNSSSNLGGNGLTGEDSYDWPLTSYMDLSQQSDYMVYDVRLPSPPPIIDNASLLVNLKDSETDATFTRSAVLRWWKELL